MSYHSVPTSSPAATPNRSSRIPSAADRSAVTFQFEKELGPPKAYAPPINASASEFADPPEDDYDDTLIRVATATNKIGDEETRSPRPDSSGAGGGGGWENSSGRMPNFSDTQRCLLVVGFLTAVITVSVIVIIADSVHTIEEGNVGIYYVQGALSDDINPPGVHWATPFVTTIEEIAIRPITDTLAPAPAVTNDSITVTFQGIQVLSDIHREKLVDLIRNYGSEFRQTLVFDRIREYVRTFCGKHDIDQVYNTKFLDMVPFVKQSVEKRLEELANNSIVILNLVIPKPEIPKDIALNYKAVKVQWTEQLVAQQRQKTEKIRKETDLQLALLDAEREKQVLAIELDKEILRKEGEKQQSSLQNDIVRDREQSVADVEAYKKTKAAAANQELYSEKYVQLEMARALSNNTKFFFSGETSVLGGLLNNIMGSK